MVTSFIELRQELWNFGIASLCNANNIVYSNNSPKHLPSASFYKYEKLNKKFTTELFQQFRIHSLLNLSTKDILELRSYSIHLREKIDTYLRKEIYEIGTPDDRIIKNCNKIYNDYLEYVTNFVEEKSKNRVFRDIFKDTVLAVTGIYFPILGIVPIAEKMYTWLKKKKQSGFTLYMTNLINKTSNNNLRNRTI